LLTRWVATGRKTIAGLLPEGRTKRLENAVFTGYSEGSIGEAHRDVAVCLRVSAKFDYEPASHGTNSGAVRMDLLRATHFTFLVTALNRTAQHIWNGRHAFNSHSRLQS